MWAWTLLVLSPIGILAVLILNSEQCKLFPQFEKQNYVGYSNGLKCCLTERKNNNNSKTMFLIFFTNLCFLIGSADGIHLTESQVLALSSFLHSSSNSCTPVPSTNRDKHVYLTAPNLPFAKRGEQKSESHSVVSDSLQPYELYSPWNSPSQNTEECSCSLLPGNFPTQGTVT